MLDLTPKAEIVCTALQRENIGKGTHRRAAAICDAGSPNGCATLITAHYDQRQPRVLACRGALHSNGPVFHRFLRYLIVADEAVAESCLVYD